MKIFITIFIILAFGLVGYILKERYKREYELLLFLNDFVGYYDSNLTLFKNNIIEIIDNFIIMQKNKNAKYIKLFQKNGNLYTFNTEILNEIILVTSNKSIIEKYFNEFGKSDYQYEKEKNKNFQVFLEAEVKQSLKNLNEKGMLIFKIMLAIGACLAIILW